jgi:diguanylate cyclase (GGDEF)-like protein/PAS domain S-box-containing protein
MLTSSDKANVTPILNSIGAYVYLLEVLNDGTFRYFAINWQEDEDVGLLYTGSVIGKRPEEAFEAERAARLNEYYHRCVEGRSHLEFEGSFISASGQRWSNHFLAPIFDLNGQIVRIMGTVVDITKRKLAEQALQESKERYHTLFNDNPAKIITVDLDGTILSINKFGAEYFGFTGEEVVKASIIDFIYEDDRQIAKHFLEDIKKSPDKLQRAEFRSLKKNGDIVWMSNTARVAVDEEGKKVILVVSDDTTRMHELTDELHYQASHDSLTGLVNRHEFERRLIHMVEEARSGSVEHALCYLDLDQFKIINDTCGHVAGDELLRQLGNLLDGRMRRQDTLARLGGDEFAILMERCSLDEAEAMCKSYCRIIEDYHFLCQEKRFHISVSIGIVAITAASGGLTNMLSAADRACYVAKDKHECRIHIFREDDQELKKRHGEMEWVNKIKTAIAENRLHLYFQRIIPIDVRYDTGEYYEILLRLETEGGHMVTSEIFLPAAEHYNIANRLDRWVIQHTFSWLASHPHHVDKLSLCTINLSGSTLGDDTFIDFVLDQFNNVKIPANRICFEITETAAITNLTNAMHLITILKDYGFQFALDDFGSGWSSLAYLKKFPVDYVKIDGIFMKDIGDDPINLALVKSINEIGQLMGKKTIAESVESYAVREKLREIGVDFCQGYGMGRPCPIAEKK